MATARNPLTSLARDATGIEGLDSILRGGLPQKRLYLVHGGPGTGKTTLSFQFLMEGARRGQKCLYITLLQSKAELDDVIGSHGWSTDGITIIELPDKALDTVNEQTLFNPSEIELSKITDEIIRAIEEHTPDRFVLDSISELSVLVDSSYQLRRQLLKLKRALQTRETTAIINAGDTTGEDIPSIETIANGVIKLQQHSPAYGEVRRRLEIKKMRGMTYQGGLHDLRIRAGGLDVFPRIIVSAQKHHLGEGAIVSGNEKLDTLLGGGMEKGTSCLITGTTGAGKSTLTSLYVEAAAKRGDHSLIFCFDERRETYLHRCRELGIDMEGWIQKGRVDLRQMDVGEYSPGEFMHAMRTAVEQNQTRLIVIDSLTGCMISMSEEPQLIAQFHELLSYLSAMGVLTLMTINAYTVSGTSQTSIDASYLADTVVLLRLFEAMGQMRRCISVLKKRHGAHESTIREMKIDKTGIHLGESLKDFSGILTGCPRFEGSHEQLMETDN